MMFMRVDLPDPEGPMMDMNSPFSILSVTPRSASRDWLPIL